MRVCFYDLETTDLSALMGRVLCCSVAGLEDGVKTLRGDKAPYKSNDPIDDHKLVVAIRDMLEQADMIVGWNCPAAETPILTHDLQWKAAGDLVPGDKVAAFDEQGPNRHFQVGEVTSNKIEYLPATKVYLSNGDDITVTNEHPWLVSSGPCNEQRWVKTKNLRLGTRVNLVLKPETPQSNTWLTGIVDGEGSIGERARVNIYQQEGDVSQRIRAELKEAGFSFGESVHKDRSSFSDSDTISFYLQGGYREGLRFLAKYQPSSIRKKFDWEKLATVSRCDHPWVVAKEDVVKAPITRLGTTTSTYIAGGYAMHNSKMFDIPFLNARLAKHGERPLTTHFNLDLMYYAGGTSMRIGSRKLDNVAKYFNLDNQKTAITWEDWQRAGSGDSNAMNQVVEHCEADIRVLREAYGHLLPYVKTLHR